MSKNVLSPDEAAESLEAIRSVIDRTTRYTHISWLGVVLAGGTGAATAATGWIGGVSPATQPGAFLSLWGLAFLAALACALWTTARKASVSRERLWSRKLQTVTAGLLPCAVVGALLTAVLADTGRLDLAPGAWMSLYGLGILAVGHVLDWEFQLTAWAFLLSSSAAFFLLRGLPHLSMLLSFGAIHLFLGGFRFFKERPWQRV